MNREEELALAREHVRQQAAQVARLLAIASRKENLTGEQGEMAEEQLAMFENMLWRNHRRLVHLKAKAEMLAVEEPPKPLMN